MRMQDSQANCGSIALHNALCALGIRRSPKECEALCKVTAERGVSEADLVAAFSAVRGCKPYEIRTEDAALAMGALRDALHRGRPAILSVDADAHYVAAVGVLGDRVLVADGADNELVRGVADFRLSLRWGSEVVTIDDKKKYLYWAVVA